MTVYVSDTLNRQNAIQRGVDIVAEDKISGIPGCADAAEL